MSAQNCGGAVPEELSEMESLCKQLVAGADRSRDGVQDLVKLFEQRVPRTSQAALRPMLWTLSLGLHPLVQNLPHPMRYPIYSRVSALLAAMPDAYFGGECLGSLILLGALLESRHDLQKVAAEFSTMFGATDAAANSAQA